MKNEDANAIRLYEEKKQKEEKQQTELEERLSLIHIFKHAEDMDIRYLLGIDPDRLLAPYLKLHKARQIQLRLLRGGRQPPRHG